MPPHCDSLDGPVVAAARRALELGDVEEILPYAPAEAEAELRSAFDLVRMARVQGPESEEVADRYFFETAVRVHRAGEGAAFTGLKPAGLDVGPVIPLAEDAIASGNPAQLIGFMFQNLQHQLCERFNRLTHLQSTAATLPERREYVHSMLGFQVWAHKLYGAMQMHPHEDEHSHAEPAPEEHAHAA